MQRREKCLPSLLVATSNNRFIIITFGDNYWTGTLALSTASLLRLTHEGQKQVFREGRQTQNKANGSTLLARTTSSRQRLLKLRNSFG